MEHHNENFWNQIKTLIYGLFVYLKIDTEPILVLTVLMCIDTLLGIIKVIRLKPNTFSAKDLFLGFGSKLAFLLLPLTLALIGKNLHYDFTMLVVVAIKILTISEGISIISNLISIKTKKEIENYDIITGFLKYIRTLLINMATYFMKNKK